MKKILFFLIITMFTTLSYTQPKAVVNTRFKIKIYPIGAMQLARPIIIKPEIYADSIGNLHLFGENYPKQYTHKNIAPEIKAIKIDSTFLDSLGIVGGVLIELRKEPSGRSIGTIQQLGWVDTTGNIIGLYGGDLSINLIPPDRYWVAVILPNSFPVMTPNVMTITGTPGELIQWDFTTGLDKCYGGSLYPIGNYWGTLNMDFDNTAIIDMGDVSKYDNNQNQTGFNSCDVDNNNIVNELDWNLMNENFGEFSRVPCPWDFLRDIQPEGDANIAYKLIASNFAKTGNTNTFDISIQNIGSEPIWLRSIQCVFKFPRNNVANLTVSSTYFNFWQMPTVITDIVIYVTGLTYAADTNWMPTTNQKIFTVQIDGNIDSMRFSNNSIQRTKLYKYPYDEFTDSTFHIIDRLTSIKTNGEIPLTFSLSQNFPNPFNPTTAINFTVPKTGLVKLKIYNMIGKEISTLVNEIRTAGNYSVNFDASGLSSGTYFYKLEAGGMINIKKMMLIK